MQLDKIEFRGEKNSDGAVTIGSAGGSHLWPSPVRDGWKSALRGRPECRHLFANAKHNDNCADSTRQCVQLCSVSSADIFGNFLKINFSLILIELNFEEICLVFN